MIWACAVASHNWFYLLIHVMYNWRVYKKPYINEGDQTKLNSMILKEKIRHLRLCFLVGTKQRGCLRYYRKWRIPPANEVVSDRAKRAPVTPTPLNQREACQKWHIQKVPVKRDNFLTLQLDGIWDRLESCSNM